MSERVRVYDYDKFLGFATLWDEDVIGEKTDRCGLGWTRLYLLDSGRYILASWDCDDHAKLLDCQLFSPRDAARWLLDNRLEIPDGLEAALGGVDFDDAEPSGDAAPLSTATFLERFNFKSSIWRGGFGAPSSAASPPTDERKAEIARPETSTRCWWAELIEPVGDVAAILRRVEKLRRAWLASDTPPQLGDLGYDSPPQAAIDKLWEAMLTTGKATPDRPRLPPFSFADAARGRSPADLWGEYHTALNAASAWCEAQLAAEAANRPTPENAGGKDTKPPGAAGDKLRAAVHTKKPKRSTERGEGRTKLIAALTKHHKYASGGCLNLEPIGNNELARQAGVSESTASAFFRKEFGGHTKYRAACGDSTRLVTAIKLLNQEFSPHLLFGRNPPGEGERGDEE